MAGDPPSVGGNIKVVVRCRPMNSKEKQRGDSCIISMSGDSTTIEPPPSSVDDAGKNNRATDKKPMTFAFDHSYWSAGNKTDSDYASQETLYRDLGVGMLDHSFQGFNTCIFAYGQTGYGEEKGIIPLVCLELFRRANAMVEETFSNKSYSYSVEVSYIEIYNEKVRDLLNPKNKGNLKVREHPSLGPYVEDLSKLVVKSYDELVYLQDEGNKARTVAATQMNETSSRSHAVFTLILTQKTHDGMTDMIAEKVSRISLVDLAGSERANSTGATGARLKEGANINKSLTTLGKVIAALAAASGDLSKGKVKKNQEHIPYRDSVLTWLLKDCLGGNSQTAMIAAIAPCSASYDETLSTLRYADQTKKIKTRAVVNEDPNAKMIRELREELEMLRSRASGANSDQAESFFDATIPPEKQMVTFKTKEGEVKTVSKAEIQEQLHESEKIMKSLNETWEEKLQKTEQARVEREAALEELGITVDKGGVGVHTPKKMPHLVNLNEDPLMSECLVYQLKLGKTVVGNIEGSKPVAIRLSGSEILEEHAIFNNEDGKVTVEALPESMTLVNGRKLPPGQPQTLKSGYRLILGDYHVFRFNNPEEVRKARDRTKSALNISVSASTMDLAGEAGSPNGSPSMRPDSPSSTNGNDEMMDWTYAKRELALARLNGEPGFDKMKDEDLDKVFDHIQRVRTLRKGRPDSRLSVSDDLWSENGVNPRHLSTSTSYITDDTSVIASTSANPWGSPLSASDAMETLKPSPLIDGVNAAVHDYSPQKNRYGNQLSTSVSDSGVDRSLEKAHLEKSMRMFSTEMRRLLQARAANGSEDETPFIEPELYSANEIRSLTRVISKWKTLARLTMAERILSNAAKLKEANVIAKSLGQNVTYNFIILEPHSTPMSVLDKIVGLTEFDEAVPSSGNSISTCSVGIKVLDSKHNSLYLWTMDKFEQQLAKQRNLAKFADRPEYLMHYSSDAPFYSIPAPSFSFVGLSKVSLAPLSRGISSNNIIPIYCRYTTEAIGSCHIDITVASSPPVSSDPPGCSPRSARFNSVHLPSALALGSKLTFSIVIDHVKGLSSLDFSSVHAQIRLSKFAGSSILNEDVFPSNTVDLDKVSLSGLNLRRKMNLMVSPEVLYHLQTSYAEVEFFAQVKPRYIQNVAHSDHQRERTPSDGTSSSSPLTSKPSEDEVARMRRSESEFVSGEEHDVSAHLTICELNAAGQYVPCAVLSTGFEDSGTVHIRQGLQRKVILSLTHNSGQALSWRRISRVDFGSVRLMDSRGAIIQAHQKDNTTLKLTSTLPHFSMDGTSTLEANGFWDSSSHDSPYLNLPTPSGHCSLVKVTFWVELDEKCGKPAVFTFDFALKTLGRTASGPGRMSLGFFGTSRLIQKITAMFSLRLTPALSKNVRDLWRLDTSGLYVKGEELLDDWQPRTIRLIDDRSSLIAIEHRAADVQAVEAILAVASTPTTNSTLTTEAEEAITRKVVDTWIGVVSDKEKPLSQIDSLPDLKKLAAEFNLPDLSPKLEPHVKLLKRVSHVSKRGFVNILTDAPNDAWTKRFIVLRRPFLHIYDSSNETNEINVIHLNPSIPTNASSVRIERNSDVELLLGRKFAFTIFTNVNCYTMQAKDQADLDGWIKSLIP